MLGRLKSFVTPSITPSSSRPSSPPPSTEGARKGSTSPPSSSSAAKSLPLPTEAQLDALRAQQIPLSDCTGCAGEGDGEWEGPDLPRKFEVDLTSEMLGSSKPMHRLALISTSKHDWPHDICDDTSSLAFHLSSVHQRKNPLPDLLGKLSLNGNKAGQEGAKEAVKVEGIYESAKESKLTVLASSVEVPHDEGVTTALVFPDFKFITSIPISKPGATALYDQALSPAPPPPPPASSPPQPELGSWTLPYKAVIMLCSHKSRDKRCSVAAPLLESVLSQTLALHGHTVDTTGASLEPEMLHAHTTGTEGVRAATEGSKEVGIFKISHLGGHRYSGVMIIALPTGAMLYYGRVRPRDCVAIVEETILGGKVLPQHLRSGGNLGGRKEGKTLLDW